MVVTLLSSRCNSILWLMSVVKSLPKIRDGPVKEAVTKDFKEVITESGRDAFILFYAPWCRQCHKILPIWDELGDKLKNEDVDIVKVDATANKFSSDYDVVRYPTIYWKFADKTKKPDKYTGHRSLRDFMIYASKNASKELNGWDRRGKPRKKKS